MIIVGRFPCSNRQSKLITKTEKINGYVFLIPTNLTGRFAYYLMSVTDAGVATAPERFSGRRSADKGAGNAV